MGVWKLSWMFGRRMKQESKADKEYIDDADDRLNERELEPVQMCNKNR